MLYYVTMFLGAAGLSFLLAFPVRAAALRFGVVDHPEKRKMHQIPIPLLGGLAISAAFWVVACLTFLAWDAFAESSPRSFLGLMVGTAVILIIGIYDDVKGLRPRTKLGGQTLAALAVVAMGDRIDLFTNPLGSSFEIGWLGIPLTIFWIVGVTNAVNLIDGLDGLAVGIGGIAALGMFAVAASGSPFVAGLTIILAGASFGFLPHNFYPAKVFLGDTGSMFIGFCLAVTGLHGSLKATTATVLFLPIIVLGMPIFDTLFAIFRRAKRRVSPFKADREHIHHRLVRIGLHHRNVVLVLYFACVYLALTAYSIAQFPYQTAFAFVVLLTMGGIIGIRTLQFIEEKLESHLARGRDAQDDNVSAITEPAVPATDAPGRSRVLNGSARRRADFDTLVCEVSGFREGFTETSEIRAMRADIQSMLGRRVQVDAVIIEPSSPGRLILLLRTAPMKLSLQVLVQNGLAWYLEDQKARFSTDPSFPDIQWLRSDPPSGGSRTGGEGGVRSAAPDATSGPGSREDAGPLPFREGRAGAASS